MDLLRRPKGMENEVATMGKKVVAATEKAFAATKLCEEVHVLLMSLQTEIAELYEKSRSVTPEP